MTAFLVASGVGCFVGLQLFALGVILGVWTYAHLYQNFQNREEVKYQRKLGMEIGKFRLRELKVEQAKDRMTAAYGRSLPETHKAILDEEVERALGTTWARKDDGKR